MCALLLFIGLILRAAWLRFYGIPSQEGLDAGEYMALARHLAGGLGFTTDGVTPSHYRPPLFACLLGGWCYLFGSTSLGTMVSFQVVIQSLCAPLTYLLARRVQPSRVFAASGGLLIAIDPFLMAAVGYVLQEPIQMLVATAMGISIAGWCRMPTARGAVVAGLFFGLAALAKSPFLVAPAIALLVPVPGPDLRRRLPLSQAILATLVAAAIVVPWTVRNYRVSGGRFVPINSQDVTVPIWLMADLNFDRRESLTEPPGVVPGTAQGALLTYGNEEGIAILARKNSELLEKGVRGPAVTDALAREARWYLLTHPVYVLRKTLRGALLLCAPDSGAGLTRSIAARVVTMVLLHLPLAAGLLAGMVRSFREKDGAMGVLTLFALAYLLIHAPVSVSGGRYAVPVLPFMIAATGYSLWGARPAGPSRPATGRDSRS